MLASHLQSPVRSNYNEYGRLHFLFEAAAGWHRDTATLSLSSSNPSGTTTLPLNAKRECESVRTRLQVFRRSKFEAARTELPYANAVCQPRRTRREAMKTSLQPVVVKENCRHHRDCHLSCVPFCGLVNNNALGCRGPDPPAKVVDSQESKKPRSILCQKWWYLEHSRTFQRLPYPPASLQSSSMNALEDMADPEMAALPEI